MKAASIIATLAMASILTACSSDAPRGPRIDVTIGQQLIELKEAREAGALTDKEYERQKKALIDSIE